MKNLKKALAMLLALTMVLALAACGNNTAGDNSQKDPAPAADDKQTDPAPEAQEKDYSGYTIRIYSNSNSTERTT